MINFHIYLFHRLHLYFNSEDNEDENYIKARAFIGFCFVMLFHFMTIQNFLDAFIFNGNILDHYFSYDKYTRRFIYAPIVTSPLFLGIYVYYRLNRNRIDEKLLQFKNESELDSKKGKKKIIIYLICTLILLALSITSTKW
jgi:hypothetical protein